MQDVNLWPILPPLPSYGRGREMPGPRYGSLIHGQHVNDFVLTGTALVLGAFLSAVLPSFSLPLALSCLPASPASKLCSSTVSFPSRAVDVMKPGNDMPGLCR